MIKKSTHLHKNKSLKVNARIDSLYKRVSTYLQTARQNVVRAVDTEMVNAYWLVGRDIVEEEQYGKKRASYGKEIITKLSIKLQTKFGKGFSQTSLKDMRQFYLTYCSQKQIRHAVRGEFTANFSSNLSWLHYRILMRIGRPEARNFYTIEAINNKWSGRELERQVNSLLFDRLAKSRDKKGLLRLAKKGQEIFNPQDATKDPIVLEFLGIPEAHQIVESELEAALINNLQHFLMELGKGFAFVARQKRLTLDGDHFYTDLVFYHTILKCYVIIDIKAGKLTHADLGQIQLYVNYFDQEVRTEGDNPTIGLILCTEKSDAMVKYTLGTQAKQIFANKYQFHLPTEKDLENEIKREINIFKTKLIQKN